MISLQQSINLNELVTAFVIAFQSGMPKPQHYVSLQKNTGKYFEIFFYYLDASCDSGEFYCPSGRCISWSSTCDGIWDCPGGADEPSVCGDTTKGM
jgi:hypothetical protein